MSLSGMSPTISKIVARARASWSFCISVISSIVFPAVSSIDSSAPIRSLWSTSAVGSGLRSGIMRPKKGFEFSVFVYILQFRLRFLIVFTFSNFVYVFVYILQFCS